ncbi:hypothetical protein ASG39_16235 [Rhizobium sp. Leaf371]|uniref:DUF4174 domain-containing protein n=1 Tax=unclassified Rhizobium TaxID=2613769 RepID=UPI0007153633|nr:MULTISPECIES: DUF4174 domain-containing protein [unclassified Rhizobium]KQS63422.1 hypothetical protein ASG39_16235 [Rhizobium sp. Leaf371]TCM57557.1 uncharacterized protein DUF4174 [Rhizobium sp. PP-F2F-G48]
MLKSLMTEIFGVGPHPEETSGNLHDLQWEKRVVVIFSDPAGIKSDAQLRALKADTEGLRDRDLAVFTVNGNDVRPEFGSDVVPQAHMLRKELGCTPGTFALVLVGKDGHVKARFDDVVDPAVLFAEIDSMPMRRAEIDR